MKANKLPSKGVDYWTKRISEQEMPALCSTIKALEKLEKDDVSSLAKLGNSVMHDNALTSRILRVANSAIYNKGISHITTVSRAAVVLGFDTIRNICITAKLLSSLLENKNLSPQVYKRLLKLMAQGFQAAMLAKMILGEHQEELQEEVFIAALLYQLGESAFWSMGGEVTEQLDAQLTVCQDRAAMNGVTRELLGTSFGILTQGIARHWGLGEVLLKSLNQPNDRTPEIRSIFLANKLTELLASPGQNAQELQRRLAQIADVMAIEMDELKGRIQACRMATQELAEMYGARALVEYLPDTQALAAAAAAAPARGVDVHVQLLKLRELTGFTAVKTDFNLVLMTMLEGIVLGVGVDRCGVLLLSPNRKLLQPRLVLGDDAQLMKQSFMLDLTAPGNLFRRCVELKSPVWVDSPASVHWSAQLDAKQAALVSAAGFLLAPLLVANKVIGVCYADRHSSQSGFTQEDFDSFTHFIQLTNICLGISLG
ncbi:HDOD domain-containing protein [Shewanella salipaludis]